MDEGRTTTTLLGLESIRRYLEMVISLPGFTTRRERDWGVTL
jgi:hypothetical protein